jgi:enoyl-CoA hydratase/carnithine racemase
VADLLIEKRNHIGFLTLNRPDRMNAISVEMLTMFNDALAEFDDDKDVRGSS